jgi:monofunctional biosynthetic peptidoglycan transglycosylase
VLISEDARFMEHIGFDWRGIRHAIERNEEAGRPVAGGSTVTQQLAKNLFLSSEKSYARKIQEALIALMLEATLSKKRILELYLNTAQWGNRLFGAQAAARHYFDVDAQTLSPAQAAQLAVLLPRPSYYDVRGTTVYVEQRTLWIQKQLPLVRIPPP